MMRQPMTSYMKIKPAESVSSDEAAAMTWFDELLAQRKPGYFYFWPLDVRVYNISMTDELSDNQKSRQKLLWSFFYTKSAIFLPGILLQILSIIYLVRGNSGYSKSARRWFLIVLGCDFASNLLRIEEILIQDMAVMVESNLLITPGGVPIGDQFNRFVWGLNDLNDRFIAEKLCYVVQSVLHLPFFMSPIALSISGILRAYSVKFPLKAKALLTRRVEWILLGVAAAVTVGLTIPYVYFAFNFVYTTTRYIVFGRDVFGARCSFPNYHDVNASQSETLAAYILMLVFSFGVCALNFVSAVVIIMVLYQSKKVRQSMSAQETNDSSAEVRATIMLLAMNLVLIVCFMVSRIIFIIASKPGKNLGTPQKLYFDTLESIASILVMMPYLLNSLFTVGLNRKFYEFYLPCLKESKTSGSSTSSVTKTKTVDDK